MSPVEYRIGDIVRFRFRAHHGYGDHAVDEEEVFLVGYIDGLCGNKYNKIEYRVKLTDEDNGSRGSFEVPAEVIVEKIQTNATVAAEAQTAH